MAKAGTPLAGLGDAATDARGDYLRCPHCGMRIPMKRISTNAGVGFRIAG